MSEKFEMTNTERDNTTAVVQIDGADFIADLTTAETAYCSLAPETIEEKTRLFNAINQPAAKLSDMIGKQIEVSDVFCEVIQCVNEKTGEVTKAPRIILFDNNGNSYSCVSVGIFGSLKKIFAIFGEPREWEAPLRFEVRQIERGGGKRILSLNLISA